MDIWQYFCFQYLSSLHTMQELTYLGKRAPISVWFRMVLTWIITQMYKDSLTLTYPFKYEHLTSITLLIPMGRFFDTIIDVRYWYHAVTYVLDKHWLWHSYWILCPIYKDVEIREWRVWRVKRYQKTSLYQLFWPSILQTTSTTLSQRDANDVWWSDHNTAWKCKL